MPFGRFDTDAPEYLRLRQRVFNGFPHFLDLVDKAPDLLVTDLRRFLEFHDADAGIVDVADHLDNGEGIVDRNLCTGFQQRPELFRRSGKVFLVVALLAEVDLPVFKDIDDNGNKERHALELVVLALELAVFLGELVHFHLHIEQGGFELVELDLVFELGGRCSVTRGSLFHTNLICLSSTIYVV